MNSPVKFNIDNNSIYFLDMLENGNYSISHLDNKLNEFEPNDATKAMTAYMLKAHPLELLIPTLNQVTLY